jgi:hypothetical protein
VDLVGLLDRLADCEDELDRLGQEATRDEGQCLGRYQIEPLGVIDQ